MSLISEPIFSDRTKTQDKRFWTKHDSLELMQNKWSIKKRKKQTFHSFKNRWEVIWNFAWLNNQCTLNGISLLENNLNNSWSNKELFLSSFKMKNK